MFRDDKASVRKCSLCAEPDPAAVNQEFGNVNHGPIIFRGVLFRAWDTRDRRWFGCIGELVPAFVPEGTHSDILARERKRENCLCTHAHEQRAHSNDSGAREPNLGADAPGKARKAGLRDWRSFVCSGERTDD